MNRDSVVPESNEPINVLSTAGRNFLLVHRNYGAIHLAPAQLDGRAAIGPPDPDSKLPLLVTAEELQHLLASRWAPRTLCGRRWDAMVWAEITDHQAVGYAPSCGSCLHLLRPLLSSPPPDPGLPLVVELATDLLLTWSQVFVENVPGDQTELLRQQMRAAARAQGVRCTTCTRPNGVLVDSEDAWNALPQPVRDNFDDMLMDQLSRLIVDGIAPETSSQPWVVDWRTWAA
jgi:hypothetical protein